MKRLFIAASALFLFTGATHAQSAQQDKATIEHHQHGGFGHHRGGMMQKLNLSEEQKKQFKELNESYRKQFTDLRNNKSLSADDQKAKMEALHKEQFSKTQALLTPEQKTQLAEQRKQFAGRGHQFGEKGRGAGGGNFEQMKSNLGLSDDQVAKLKAGREIFHTKMEAIRSNTSLTEDQKKEQVRALAKEQHENFKSILTPDQLEKMKAARKNKFGSK